ncbi:hypothetical protein HDU79_000374, partial [Rhizoclosmatium sp. JEL0117]
TKRLSIANNAKNLFVSKKESGVSLRVALSDSEDTSAANTAPASLPRNWRASRRSSAEHPPVEPPVSTQASSTTSRRMSFFKSQNSPASAPIDDSSHTSHSPIEPFQIPVSSILSVTKTRSSPVHLTANAILIETRNTSDAVFSHTSKHVFYGFASAVKLPSLEKKISSLVEAWREKEGENVVKKKGVPRRPSVGTSALYSLLAGKDGDDYSHITSDLIVGDQLTSEKKVVAGPETIRLQVTKNLSGNSRVADSDAENGLGGGTGEPQTIRSSEKSGIIEAFALNPTAMINIYYKILVSSDSNTLYMLSNQARLANIFKKVNDLQNELLFVFHSRFVLTISAKNGNVEPVVVELEETDIALLKKMIASHFGGITNVLVYYQSKETNSKTSVNDSESLQGALTDSGCVFFEPSEPVSHPTPSFQPVIQPMHLQRESKSHKGSGLFISYNWSTKVHVNAVVNKLQALKPNLKIWLDTENMESNIYDSMRSGIAGCQVFVACFSKGYLDSVNCMLELQFAQDLKKTIIPLFFFEDNDDINALRLNYSAFLIISGKLYTDFRRWDKLDSRKITPSVSKTLKSPLDNWLLPESFASEFEGYAQEYVPGTRLWIITALESWILTEEQVLYLNGGAGTGKSLIVYSLTRNLPSNFVIGALFICRYNDVHKSDPIILVSSVVSNLCLSLGGTFKEHIEMELEADIERIKEGKQSIIKSPVEAFNALVVNGFKKLQLSEWRNKTLLIVIDALDELRKENRHS